MNKTALLNSTFQDGPIYYFSAFILFLFLFFLVYLFIGFTIIIIISTISIEFNC